MPCLSAAAQQPNGFGRSQLVVVPLEGRFRAQETSKLLKQLAQVGRASVTCQCYTGRRKAVSAAISAC